MKKVKVGAIVNVYDIIKDAKFTKMDDSDKINIWKILKVIKPIWEAFNKDLQDAREKFVPYDTFMEDYSKAQAYEIAKTKKESYDKMTDDEYKKFIGELVKYNNLVGKAIEEMANKEIELDVEPISSEAFDQLKLSNDWTFNQSCTIESLVCE